MSTLTAYVQAAIIMAVLLTIYIGLRTGGWRL